MTATFNTIFGDFKTNPAYGNQDFNSKLRAGWWELHVTTRLMHLLQPGDVFIDIGAHYGWFTFVARHLKANVIAFEPSTVNFGFLLQNGSGAACYNYALSDKNGWRKIHLNRENMGDHSLNCGVNRTKMQPVQCWRFDAFMKEHYPDCKHARLVKIDVQGHEYEVLRGFGEWLSRCDNIICEFSPDEYEEPLKLLKLLKGYGFNMSIMERETCKTTQYKYRDMAKRMKHIKYIDLLFERGKVGIKND